MAFGQEKASFIINIIEVGLISGSPVLYMYNHGNDRPNVVVKVRTWV